MATAERQFESQLSQLADIRAFVRACCDEHQLPSRHAKEFGELELALQEAATNVIRHAYAGVPGRPIWVQVDAEPHAVAVHLLHHGGPFDRQKVRPPVFDGHAEGGWGVYLIEQSVDEVCYECPEQGRSMVKLLKRFSKPKNEEA